MNRNFQKEMEQIVRFHRELGEAPALLLHSCCGPCSSSVLEQLTENFRVTVFYFNPNISPREEYEKRVEEQRRLLEHLPAKYPVSFWEGRYVPEEFYQAVQGLEHISEGGERCFVCYRQRLREAAIMAAAGGFDYFTTTLSVSPMKNAAKLNEIGLELSGKYGVKYLVSDFKKRDGYKRSIELSEKYGMYRQDYCGCVFSKEERREKERKKALQNEDFVLK
ncbi:epoxyqueuosine reductase QueH [Hominifimenecus sp. rT4P-3]|uniref:epoxyqueuosine reductase QueH n=1 Tax=Hominifimenecus sp. rT4P-3 TaxID=3242979 RepID=UPI003DA643BE